MISFPAETRISLHAFVVVIISECLEHFVDHERFFMVESLAYCQWTDKCWMHLAHELS